MSYLQSQIEERQRKLVGLERDVKAAEAVIQRATELRIVVQAELNAYLDIAANVRVDDSEVNVARLETEIAATPKDTQVMSLVPAPSGTPKALQVLSGAWRHRYRVLAERSREFTTDDLVQVTSFEVNPPIRKSLRGTLSEHVQRGLLERIEEGCFRFVMATQGKDDFEALLSPAA